MIDLQITSIPSPSAGLRGREEYPFVADVRSREGFLHSLSIHQKQQKRALAASSAAPGKQKARHRVAVALPELPDEAPKIVQWSLSAAP